MTRRDAGTDAPAGSRDAAGGGRYSLVLQTSFLGDVVLTTPLIAQLARRGPVDVVVSPAAAPLLANNPDVRRLVVYDKRGADRGVAGMRALARRLRDARRDAGAPPDESVAYLAQGSLRSGMLARLAGFRRRVGFDTSAGRTLYTERVPYARGAHHAERLYRLGSGGVAPDDPALLRPRLFPGDAERAAVDALLGGVAAAGGRPLIALAPGSVWATKRWPHYAALATGLAPRARLVVIGSGADTPLAREIVEATEGAALDATGRLSLLASAELIGRCAVIVTNDSAPQHLASAMGTPTVAIFGPTVPAFGFGPLAPRSATPGVDALPCRPCHPHGPSACPLGHWRCMRDLHVRTVASEVAQLASLS